MKVLKIKAIRVKSHKISKTRNKKEKQTNTRLHVQPFPLVKVKPNLLNSDISRDNHVKDIFPSKQTMYNLLYDL